MSDKMSRQQKREMLRKAAKEQFVQGATPAKAENDYVKKDRFELLIQDVQRILNYTKTIDNHSYMLMETLSRMGITKWEDLKNTEKLFQEREQRKKDKIKDLLSREMEVCEILDEIHEEEDLPNYEKLRINPVKDLNLNPYEVAFVLKEKYPDFTEEAFLQLGSVWNLSKEHFGFKKEETEK